MLEHADHDAGRDSLLVGKGPNGSLAARRTGDEPVPFALRNKGSLCPAVCLLLDFGAASGNLIDEDALLAVKQEVGRLVEEAEPQMIV